MRARSRDLSRLGAAAALSVVMLLGGGSASALAGPGVTLRQGAKTPPKPLTGGQIGAAADTGPTTYTLRERPGEQGTQITLSGLSMRGLLRLAGFNPGAVRFVQVVGGNGSVITLTGPDINSPPFAEGPALVTDEGATTRFFRPARSARGTSENVESVPGTPLEMTVEGGSLLSVRASASPARVKVGQSITFRASVRFRPPGAQITYVWDFGDGTRGTGAQVTHSYSVSGDLQAQVKAQGSGGSTSQCASVCEGVQAIDVQVTGQQRRPDQRQGTPQGGGGSTNPGGTGSGGTGSGTGSGGTFEPGLGPVPQPPRRKAPPAKARRPEPHTPFSSDPGSGAGKTIVQGVLLAGSGAPVAGGLPRGKAAGSPKPAQGVPGTANDPSQLAGSVALALAIVSLGALRERRRVRLRVA